MLELRPSCENCAAPLLPNSAEAFICSFECTFCRTCVETVLHNVCPNCGGGFQQRPVRPSGKLPNTPARATAVEKPVNLNAFAPLLAKWQNVPPNER